VTRSGEEKYLKGYTSKKEKRESERGEEKQGKGYHIHLAPSK
jgi:hypothetical protein